MTFFGFIMAHIWEIILAIAALLWALLKFNYNLFNRVIKTEVENNNYRLKEEIRNEFKEDIKKEVRHEVNNQIVRILHKDVLNEK
jgi:hypothetical protein